MKCSSSTRVTAGLLLSFLALAPATSATQQVPLLPPTQPPVAPNTHAFSLRHIYHRGTYQDPYLHKKLDIQPHHAFLTSYEDETPQQVPPPLLTARSNSIQIDRLMDRRYESIEEHLQYASLTGEPRVLDTSHWTRDEVPGPNVTDKDTVINLAIMAANAYVPTVGEGEWEDVSLGYNLSTSFGWEGDGLRGYIFGDEGNKTVVVALKGTSPAVFDGDGTTTRDKVNDNLFFSCCCAQGGQYFWRQVCDCYSSTYTCNSTCLIKSLKQKTRYYTAAIDLYTNVTELYPDSNIWIVGHSLGGAVSALLGLTFGLPVVTYEAPGDDLAARRLGLPVPSHANKYHPFQQNLTGAVHFGHTADPIFMGTCNGATSPCTLGGYAMESQCHTGVQCVYDTVGDHNWRVGLGYHKIHNVIDNVLKKYDTVPKCVPDSECYDCFNWKYFESNGSDSTTTSTMISTTSTRTRTATCKTPGWWGCLDKTTTPAPVVTTTYTTTSCATPGWFGCKEEVNVTVTTTTAAPSTSAASTTATTESCKTPGWFGCDDFSSTSTTTKTSHTAPMTSEPDSCETPGLFFGCYDTTTADSLTASPSVTSPPSTASATSIPSATSTTTSHKHKKKCKHPAFFGLICLD